MNGLEQLAACEGAWRGTNRLQDSMGKIDETSAATAEVVPMLGGKFVRLDYTWLFGGAPQQGSHLVVWEPNENLATAYWVDSFHLGVKGMLCRGNVTAAGAIDLIGSYPAPPGPDWGWRTVIAPGPEELRMVMYNIWPEGREEIAVEAFFSHRA